MREPRPPAPLVTPVTPQTTTSVGQPLEPGQRILLHIGSQSLPGLVIEDRGPLGVDGEQLVLIRLRRSEGDDSEEFEVPASALERVAAPRDGKSRRR